MADSTNSTRTESPTGSQPDGRIRQHSGTADPRESDVTSIGRGDSASEPDSGDSPAIHHRHESGRKTA